MIIQIRYENGRVDMFDTVSFTAPQPFPTTNMLTNFELRFDELGTCGLWLAAHYYDVSASYREGIADEEVPVARRRKGWRFLLAQASEIEDIRSIDIDGSTVMRRIAGELADISRFEECAGAALGSQPAALYPRILALYSFYEQQHGALGLSLDPDEIAAEFGFTAQMVEQVEAEWQAGAMEPSSENDEEIWEENDGCC